MSLTKVTNSMINGAPVNVLDFGAVGDGVVNDTAAFQAAINTGKSVYVPDGKYNITLVNLNENTSITGNGNKSIINVTSGNGFSYTGTPTYSSVIQISNLSFEIATLSTGVTFHPAFVNSSINVIGCNFYSGISGSQSAIGIFIYGSNGGLIKDNNFLGVSNYASSFECIQIKGDATYNCININITCNFFKDVKKGIHIIGSSSAYNTTAGHRIVNNLMIGLPSYAVELSYCDYIPIQGNMFDFCGGGGPSGGGPDFAVIYANHVHRLIIESNWISARYNSFGIYFRADSATSVTEIQGTVITGNRFITMNYGGPYGTAINIESSQVKLNGGTIANNYMSNIDNGIVLTGTALNAIVQFHIFSNQILANPGKSISLNAYVAYTYINDNTLDVAVASDAIFGKTNGDSNYIGVNNLKGTSTFRRGKLIASGNGSTKVWTIPHDMQVAPQWANASSGDPDTTNGGLFVQYDSTNIIINFVTAPISGTNNVIVNWELSSFY